MLDWIGYRWLAERYGIEPIQRFRWQSQIGASRLTESIDDFVQEFYLPSARPADTLSGHLAFALKHEGVHLEFLSRLFAKLPVTELEEWIFAEPTGQYARRAGFFYEWLTERRLAFPGVTSGNYVDALDEEKYLTGSSRNNPRWRVRDNLPGTRAYCPLVAKTGRVRESETYNCAERLHALEAEFGVDTLMRSAVWLTVKESRSSFAIEHEERRVDRIRRFAATMERRCGEYENVLDEVALTELQAEILGDRATRYGIRKSPVFIGETNQYVELVHYIAPGWEEIPEMLRGLGEFLTRTTGRSAIVRSAVVSFGFVYLHPMADGNGRISRFLVNDVLRRDGAIPAPFILPISATIAGTSVNRNGYDQILEVFSKPLMRRYPDKYRFSPEELTGEDGIPYTFEFDAYEDALSGWRYPDLTEHVAYLARIIDLTIEQEMRREASHLRAMRATRAAVKEVLEGPDPDIDRIIRSVRENNNQVSNKLKKQFPRLEEPELAARLVEAIEASLQEWQS